MGLHKTQMVAESSWRKEEHPSDKALHWQVAVAWATTILLPLGTAKVLLPLGTAKLGWTEGET